MVRPGECPQEQTGETLIPPAVIDMEEDIPIDPALLGEALSDVTEDDVWNNFLDSSDSLSLPLNRTYALPT